MRRTLATAVLTLISCLPASADQRLVDLTKIDRTIAREPEYKGQPHYALFVFGPRGEHRCWFVVDGDSLAYFDRNGNGDLTEPGERIELDLEAMKHSRMGGSGAYKAMHKFALGRVGGINLSFDLWIRNPDFDDSQDESHRERLREWDEKGWVNGSLMRLADDRSMGQTPLLLTARPEEAQITRFGGPLTAALRGSRQVLEPWPKQTLFDIELGYHNLLAAKCDHKGFAFSSLATGEVPADIQPVAKFEFPVASGEPLTMEVRLDQRCCGDSFHAHMMIPKEATTGTVKVTVSVPDWSGQGVVPAVFHFPINQQRARSEASYVMFHGAELDIKDAVNALRKRGLDVSIRPDVLLIHEDFEDAYSVRLVRNDEVEQVADALAEGTQYAAELGSCDARFEIWIRNVDKALEDPRTLNAMQDALQELSRGFVYQTWDKQLVAPR